MNNQETIFIQADKTKLRLLFFASAAFVVLGIFFLIAPAIIGNVDTEFLIVLIFGGILCISFFGFGCWFFNKKLNDNSPAIIISKDGITDNSSGVSIGFIPWIDVVEIGEVSSVGQKFVNIVVKDPQVYIDRVEGSLKRKAMQMNLKFYNAVICISANSLKCSHQELRMILEKGLEDFKRMNEKIS